MGEGNPSQSIYDQILSKEYGDASTSVSDDLPYANEVCEIESEIRKSHGQMISGIAIGEKTFSFAFDDGHELETWLVNDSAGRPSFRVFWVQW